MIIETIELHNFRNYKDEATIFNEKVNIISGKNAQGKTNLIEAVNLLSLGKSFRTRKESEMIRLGEQSCFVKGIFKKQGRAYSTGVELKSGSGASHTYYVNDAKMPSVSDILGGVYTVVFSPEDLRIVKGEPEARRRFTDRGLILLRPLYYHKLKKYRAVLKNKNALLKTENVSKDILDIYDEQLAAAGAAVMEERASHISALAAAAKNAALLLTDGEEELDIEYKPSVSFSKKGECREAFLEALAKNRERDIFAKNTEAGPHRDDIAISVGGRELRIFGSQGQQRTAAVAMRLAEKDLVKSETGEDAILLLDDVMSELDIGRQTRLLECFSGNQIFVTTADADKRLAGAMGSIKQITVENGKVI